MTGHVEALPAPRSATPTPAAIAAGGSRPAQRRLESTAGTPYGAARAPDRLGAMLARSVLRRRGMIQRAKVTGIANFVDQKHHPKYSVAKDGGDPVSYDLDQWIRKKHPLPARGAYVAAKKDRVASIVTQAVKGWDGSASIIGPIAELLVGASNADPWNETTVDDEIAGDAGGWDLAKHLLVLKGNIALREKDIDANVPSRIKIAYKKKVGKDREGTETLVIDWRAVLAQARRGLRDELMQNPSKAPPEKNAVRLLDNAIAARTKHDAALSTLHQIKAFVVTGSGQVRFKGSSTADRVAYTTTFDFVLPPEAEGEEAEEEVPVEETDAPSVKGKEPAKETKRAPVKAAASGKKKLAAKDDKEEASFNFGMNHLRFIIYLEWRALVELLAFAEAKAEPQKEEPGSLKLESTAH
jgi:hypothetical protein